MVAEYWNGERWVWVDAQLEQGSDWPPFDPCDLPPADATEPGRFATAAQVWTAYRRDEVDADRYGVDPGLPFKGHGFVRDEVLWELAHRRRDELLLWDVWGAMLSDLDGEPEPGLEELVDEVAAPPG